MEEVKERDGLAQIVETKLTIGPKKVRIVCISDTHAMHRNLRIPPGDILVHAGDITMRGEKKTMIDFD